MKFIPPLFFALTLVTGMFFFDDYGISWDEPVQHALGNGNWNYVLYHHNTWFRGWNQYYGPVIEMIEVLPERLFHIHDHRSIYLSRHFVNFIIFWAGSIFLFLLGKEIFKKDIYALLGVFILYFTPRIFAHSFYNSKDLPLLSVFIIAFYFLFWFLKRPSCKLAWLLAIISGMLFSIRIVGLMVPIFAVLFFILNVWNGNLPKKSRKFLAVYLLLFPYFAFLSFPVLWHDPIGGLKASFTIMSHFPFDDPQFFMGKLIAPQSLPLYYIPVWMGITIPIAWQIFFLAGIVAVLIAIVRDRYFFKSHWQWMLIGCWLFAPWFLVLILHSNLYDEWRHLFFTYPAFILITVFGIKRLCEMERWKMTARISCLALITIQTGFLIQFMWRNHPFENVYFNALAGKNPQYKFDVDYWGLSYRQGLEYLLDHVNDDSIRVCWENAPGNYNLEWLNEEDRQRLIEVPFDSCQYFLTNFRFHPQQYADSAWYALKVEGVTILAVEKLH